MCQLKIPVLYPSIHYISGVPGAVQVATQKRPKRDFGEIEDIKLEIHSQKKKNNCYKMVINN